MMFGERWDDPARYMLDDQDYANYYTGEETMEGDTGCYESEAKEPGITTVMIRALRYRLDAEKLKEIFAEKAKRCRQIADKHSNVSASSSCEQGIIDMMIERANSYELRATYLAPGTYDVSGELLDEIFEPIVDPAELEAKLRQSAGLAHPDMPRVGRKPHY
jgi:hypothetical protein